MVLLCNLGARSYQEMNHQETGVGGPSKGELQTSLESLIKTRSIKFKKYGAGEIAQR